MKTDNKNNLYTLEQILKDDSTPPPQLIEEGILIDKSLLLIAGSKKARKTFLAYNLGIALSVGKSFAGFIIPNANRVLIFSAEGGYYPNRDRIKKMCKGIKNISPHNLSMCFDSRIKLEDGSDFDILQGKIEEFSPKVLIIDPFVKFHNLEENSAKDMGYILNKLRNLIEDNNLSIILVHHLGKDQTHGARGSSAILGEYDSCITLSKEGGENKLQNKIEFDLRHSNSPDSRKLFFNGDTFWFLEEESAILRILKTFGTMDKKTLVDHCISSKIYSQSGAYKAIDRDFERGIISMNKDEKYYYK